MRRPPATIPLTSLAIAAALLGGALALSSCNDDSSKIPTAPAPKGVVGPTTAEVLAQQNDTAPLADPFTYESIPPLGTPVASTAPDGTLWEKFPAGIYIHDLKPGTGNYPRVGQTVKINYVGTFPGSGKEFDHSPKGKPLEFILGKIKGDRTVIEGWNLAVSTMKVGGKRKVLIPPDLAYGSRGHLPAIGPNQPLIFELELVSITGDAVELPKEQKSDIPKIDLLKDVPFGILKNAGREGMNEGGF